MNPMDEEQISGTNPREVSTQSPSGDAGVRPSPPKGNIPDGQAIYPISEIDQLHRVVKEQECTIAYLEDWRSRHPKALEKIDALEEENHRLKNPHHVKLRKLYAEDMENYQDPWRLWECRMAYGMARGEWKRLECEPLWADTMEFRRNATGVLVGVLPGSKKDLEGQVKDLQEVIEDLHLKLEEIDETNQDWESTCTRWEQECIQLRESLAKERKTSKKLRKKLKKAVGLVLDGEA